MVITEYQARLEAAFPVNKDVGILRAVSEGILLADSLITDTPILNNPLGKDIRGLIRRAGVAWRVHDLAQKGDVEYETTMQAMQHGRWHCLEIHSDPFRAQICRTDSASAFPDDSLTRQDERTANPQRDLFDDANVVPIVREDSPPLYAYLTFGAVTANQLGHLCWAMESKEGGDWIAFVNVLQRLAMNEPSPEQAAETPTKATKVQFHEHIKETLAKTNQEENK